METINFDITSEYSPEVIQSVNKSMSLSKGGDCHRTLNKLGYIHLYNYLNEKYHDESASDAIEWKIKKLKQKILFDCSSFMKKNDKDTFYLLQLLCMLYYTESNQRNQSIIDAIANVMGLSQATKKRFISNRMYSFTEKQQLLCNDMKDELLRHKQSGCAEIKKTIEKIDREWSELTNHFQIIAMQKNISLNEIKQDLSAITYNLCCNNIPYNDNGDTNAIESFFSILCAAEKISDIHKDMEFLQISQNAAHTIPVPDTVMKQYLEDAFYDQIVTWSQFMKLIDISNPKLDNEHLFTVYELILNQENFTLDALHKLNHETKDALRFALKYTEPITTALVSLRSNKMNISVKEWALTIRTLISLFLNKEKKVLKIVRNFKTADDIQRKIIFLILDYYHLSLYNTEYTKGVWETMYMIRNIERRMFYCRSIACMQKLSDMNSLLVSAALITTQERQDIYDKLYSSSFGFQYVHNTWMKLLTKLLWIDFHRHLIHNGYQKAVQTIFNSNSSIYAALSDCFFRNYNTDIDLKTIYDLSQHLQKLIQISDNTKKLEEIKKLEIEATKNSALQKFIRIMTDELKKYHSESEKNPIQINLDIWYENREYHCVISIEIDSLSKKIQVKNIIILNVKALPDKTN